MSQFGSIPNIPDVGNIDLNKLYANRKSTGSSPDYIPYNQKRGRDWYSRLSFYTGFWWLGGFAAGGITGSVSGWRSAPNTAMKIRMNSVMNGMSRVGSAWGSNAAIVAFTYNASLTLLDALSTMADQQFGTNLSSNHVAIPTLSGGIAAVGYYWGKSRNAKLLAFALGCGASLGYEFSSTFLSGKGGRF